MCSFGPSISAELELSRLRPLYSLASLCSADSEVKSITICGSGLGANCAISTNVSVNVEHVQYRRFRTCVCSTMLYIYFMHIVHMTVISPYIYCSTGYTAYAGACHSGLPQLSLTALVCAPFNLPSLLTSAIYSVAFYLF